MIYMRTQILDMIERTITVDISDAKVSADPMHVLATYSLGSCIGVCLYNQAEHTGGMLHYLFLDSSANPQRAKENPFTYADTGMKTLLEKLISIGIKKNQMKVKIAGGAKRLKVTTKSFDIGKRHYLAIRKILWENGMFIDAEDVGGCSPRTLYMNITDGAVMVKSNGFEKYI
ncbi:MAG: chemotaxis protein CheD [Planctomycetota bacterium]|nr:MAG: chemotaxis protein CheD [Planctomycetota bacterium]